MTCSTARQAPAVAVAGKCHFPAGGGEDRVWVESVASAEGAPFLSPAVARCALPLVPRAGTGQTLKGFYQSARAPGLVQTFQGWLVFEIPEPKVARASQRLARPPASTIPHRHLVGLEDETPLAFSRHRAVIPCKSSHAPCRGTERSDLARRRQPAGWPWRRPANSISRWAGVKVAPGLKARSPPRPRSAASERYASVTKSPTW